MSARLMAWSTAAVLLAAVSPARAAAATPVAVLGIEGEPPLLGLAERWSAALRGHAASRSGWSIEQTTLTVAEAKLMFACLDEDPACWAEVGKTLQVHLVLCGALRPVAAGLALTLLLFDVQQATLADRMVRTLSRTDADAAFARAAREFLSAPAEDIGSVLRVVVEQDGADVFVAGKRVGTSPVPDTSVPPGRHEVHVRLAGHKDWRRTIDTVSGEVVDVHVTLSVTPPPMVTAAGAPGAGSSGRNVQRGAPSSPPGYRDFLGWGALGIGASVGGIGLLFGILAANAEQEYGDHETPQRRAHQLADRGQTYAGAANALYGIGAALAVTGAILLASSPSQRPFPSVTTTPILTAASAGAAVSVSF